MEDKTEGTRRYLVHLINARLSPDEQQRYHELCLAYGEDNVWDTEEVQREFEIIGFMAPFVVARRKEDNIKGTLTFSHSPRFYFDFIPS